MNVQRTALDLEVLPSSPEHSLNKKPSVDDDSSNKTMKILIYISYCLMTACEGSLEPVGGSLYKQFESQLNVSSSRIAYILSVKPILSAIAAIITAWILDYFVNSHRYIAIMSIITAISISSMVYIESMHFMFIVFGVIGYCIGTVFVSYPVYIFRLYPDHQNRALFGLLCIYGTAKTIMPLLIDLSLYSFDSYGPSLNLISFLLLILSVLMLCLATPKHDELRSTKSTIGDVSDKQYQSINIEMINKRINENKSARYYSNLSFLLLILMMFSFSSFQSGTINFIQTFMVNHLNRNENIARYLISTYYFGQLFYRLVITTLFKELDPIKSMLISNIVLVIIGLIFAGFGTISFIKDSYIWLLFILYVNIGFFASPIFPGVYKWSELIKTVGGLLSGLFVIAFSLGDAGMVSFVGTMVDIFGAHIIPYPICGYILGSFCFTVIGSIVFCRYSAIKTMIIESI